MFYENKAQQIIGTYIFLCSVEHFVYSEYFFI